MTSLSTISGSTSPWASTQVPPVRHRGQGGDPLAAVTSLLGTSEDELKTELGSGKSLDDVAAAKGVSHEDLVAALKAAAPADAPTDAPTDVDPTAAAEAMAAQAGGLRPPHPPAGAHGLGGSVSSTSGVLSGSLTTRQQSSADQLASLLGTDSDDLLSELRGGTDLAELLQSRGVSRSSASAAVGEGFLLDSRA